MAEGFEARLKAQTSRLVGRTFTSADRIGIAVSGGADSMALLAAAARCWPEQVAAATVDHGLRPDAREEAQMVARWCRDHAVPHVILTLEEALQGNLQAAAREARYRLLEDWQAAQRIDWLMTAHQADDQIETMLLRLNRGAGVAGLASVRARRASLLRPLLAERRATLRGYCVERDIPFVDDPSNTDVRFDRVRLRKALAGTDLIDPAGLARSVDALADGDAALNWATDAIAADHLDLADHRASLSRTDLPREILRRLLLRMIAHLNPEAEKPRGPSLDQALVQLFDGKRVALADCVLTGGESWTAWRAPPRKSR